jgi:hypothetical protein
MNTYAENGEDLLIAQILDRINHNNFIVDIGAGDLRSFSNSRAFLDRGFKGICIEASAFTAAKALEEIRDYKLDVTYLKAPANPSNIVSLLDCLSTPIYYSLLSIDIDSFEPWLLRAILTKYRPAVVCVEFNNRIPLGIHYQLKYEPNLLTKDLTLFASMSLDTSNQLFADYDYVLLNVVMNNLIAVDRRYYQGNGPQISDLWNRGYFETNWRQTMPWNRPFEQLYSMPTNEVVSFLISSTANLGLRIDCRIS